MMITTEEANERLERLRHRLQVQIGGLYSLQEIEECFQVLRNVDKKEEAESEMKRWFDFVSSQYELTYKIDQVKREVIFVPKINEGPIPYNDFVDKTKKAICDLYSIPHNELFKRNS